MPSQPTETPNRGRKNTRVLALALLAIPVLGGAAVVVRNKSAAAPAPAAKPHIEEAESAAAAAPEVKVATAMSGALRQPIRVTGTLKTDETVTLSTKATGMIREVRVKEGDRVRKGELLVLIDDQDLRAQRDRALAAVRLAEAQAQAARAQVRSMEAKLQQARTGRDMKNVAADSEHRRAEEALLAAKTKLSQAKSLAGISETESETRVSSARAAVQSAKERLKTLQDGARRQELAAAESAVKRAEAQVSRMKSMLDRREQLYQDRAIAAEAVDNARRDFEVSQQDLESARQQLSLVKEGPRTEEIRVAEEGVRQAEATLKDAEANRARRKISSEDVETAENLVRQAEATVESTKANLAQSRVNEDEIRSAQASVAQAKASVAQAEAAAGQARADVRFQDEQIAQTRVFSPVNGVVTKRSAQPGTAVVQMRNELLTLVSSDTLYFEATSPEATATNLRSGLAAEVMLDAAPGRKFRGTIREIIPVAEGTNRSIRLRISLPKPPEGLAVVGGFARATIAGQSRSSGYTVPRTALTSDEGEIFVYVVEGEKAVRRKVTVTDPGGSDPEANITGGLSGGEQIVVEGAQDLVDGQEVKIRG